MSGKCNICGEDYFGLAGDCRCTNYGEPPKTPIPKTPSSNVAHFINLTNGIEAIPRLKDYHFIRVQSTACEQKRWDFILQDLDNNLLMFLALGYKCIIHDFSAKKKIPRACYQGIPFIEYVLSVLWFNLETKPIVHGCNCQKYFRQLVFNLEDRTKKKLKYFRKFLLTDKIHIECKTDQTENDGNCEFYKEILKNEV